MGLAESCKSCLSVVVKPVYGWGWTCLDAPEIRVPAEINGVPRPFKCRITEFIHYQDNFIGAIGKIEETTHIYNGLWTFFYLRVSGVFNFTDKVGYYNLEIGPSAPEKPANKEWFEFTFGSPRINGYSIVAESLQQTENFGLTNRL